MKRRTMRPPRNVSTLLGRAIISLCDCSFALHNRLASKLTGRSIETISTKEIQEQQVCHDPSSIVLVDVRNPEEVDKGALKRSVNIPTDQIPQRLRELPADRDIVFYCPNGVRAEMAYNMLKTAGRESRYLDASIRIDKDGNFKIKQH